MLHSAWSKCPSAFFWLDDGLAQSLQMKTVGTGRSEALKCGRDVVFLMSRDDQRFSREGKGVKDAWRVRQLQIRRGSEQYA